MSNTKTVMGQASNQFAPGPDVTEVFNTYLWKSSTSGATINVENGIDIATEGGMFWAKSRSQNDTAQIYDTTQSGDKYLVPSETSALQTETGAIAFNTDGVDVAENAYINSSFAARTYVGWTFRKAPKFFDIVEFEITRDGSNNLTSTSSNVTITNGEVTVDHNLGVAPAIWFQKCLTTTAAWYVRSTISGTVGGYGQLHRTSAWAGVGNWTFPATDTQVGFGNYGFFPSGTHTYVAYLFAHNNGDGEFGPDGDQDIIKCGSYTTDGSEEATIDLGWEPQWVLFKRTDSSTGGDWNLFDTMRGLTADTLGDGAKLLEPNTSDAELATSRIAVTPTGFKVDNYGASRDFIYMAIRRGPLAPPESATEVFAIDSESTTAPTPPSYNTGFAVDMFLSRRDVTTSGSWYLYDRLRKSDVGLIPNATNAELVSGGSYSTNDRNDGIGSYTGTVYSNKAYGYMWKRAPNFCDVVAYTGNGTAGRTVSHNLGVVPEMIWVKKRSGVDPWCVYHTGLDVDGDGRPETDFIRFSTSAASDSNTLWNDTAPTSTEFTLGTNQDCNHSGNTFIAYLFASLPGISKVGSYTADGNAQNIDCGFTSGARFVLIKRTDTSGNWFVLDTARGIVSGNDPLLELNSTGAEDNQYDNLDPYSAGFTVAAYGGTSPYLNISGGEYIFYAIA